jgi:indolepyruvate ferredoxin oxidoreductase
VDRWSRAEQNVWLEAGRTAEAIFGDQMMTNTFMLGAAYQAGRLPVGAASLETAIQMNGVAVERNLQAFRYGRLFEHDPGALTSLLGEPERSYHEERERYLARLGRDRRAYVELLGRAGGLDERLRRMLAIRLGELIQYQDVAYASRYLERVLAVHQRERAAAPGRDDLTEAAIRNLYKLMAYKDEYEVARLLLKGEWAERLRRTFVDPKVRFNLHPPFLREHGLARKLELGSWFGPFLALLVPLRRLRGGPLDPFGRSEVRRTERELVAWYETLLDEISAELSPANYQAALQIAGAPDRIRGYEQIKLRSAQATRDYVERKRAELREVPASA